MSFSQLKSSSFSHISPAVSLDTEKPSRIEMCEKFLTLHLDKSTFF